jgi:hypothetical protein
MYIYETCAGLHCLEAKATFDCLAQTFPSTQLLIPLPEYFKQYIRYNMRTSEYLSGMSLTIARRTVGTGKAPTTESELPFLIALID